jgi:hypothetical protein
MRKSALVLSVFLLLVSVACTKKSPTAPDDPIVVAPKPTATILCGGSALCQINYNSSATISWSSTNTASCSVTGTTWTGTSGSQSSGVLTASREYELKCVGTNGETVTATTRVMVSAQVAPSAFNLSKACTAVNSSSQRVDLSWTVSTNAVSYRVERHVWSSGAWGVVVPSQSATTFSETLPNNADYYYRVFAVNTAGEKVSNPAELLGCTSVVPPTPPPPTIPGGPGTPKIGLSFVPAKGSFENLRGTVLHVLPADHKVACWITVLGGWFPKPTYQNPVVGIDSNGNWSCDITTGGVDEQATEIRAYLVTNTYVSFNLPSVNGRDVLDVAVATR